jgi:hypothetical protein
VTKLVTDSRATQYWDEGGAVVEPFTEMFSLSGPCAGIFMIYGRDRSWEGSGPPEPDYWEDAHARELSRNGIQFDPEQFANQARAFLE